MRVGHQLCYVRIDHLLQTEGVNCEEAFQEVVPYESSVQGQGRVHHRVHHRVLVFQRQLETNRPVTEPIPQSGTRDSLAAQEPVSVSPERIPVTDSELSVASQMQLVNETIPRSKPVRAEH